METAGAHRRVERLSQKVHGRFMVMCWTCRASAQARSHDEAVQQLSKTRCAVGCENCDSLRDSNERRPAVPANGSCNDVLHTCPTDGNRWFQFNTHFHLWKQITSDREWSDLKNPGKYDLERLD